MSRALLVHKFGGSSLATAEHMQRVADILLGRDERQVVVVSAMRGVTDRLIAVVNAAARGEPVDQAVDALRRQHLDAAKAVGADAALEGALARDFERLSGLLEAQRLMGALSVDVLDAVSGLGEVWSAQLVRAALAARDPAARWLDAREVLVVDRTELGAAVCWDETRARVARAVDGPVERLVVTGFVARERSGRVTTLGRNGSDFSGAIFAALLDAAALHVWSDVDGILSADPRVVPEAVLVERLSYAEAFELAYFGARVLHPQTMAPAFARGIPIVARNTFNPAHPGTRIDAEVDRSTAVKGVTTFGGLAVLDVEGAGLIGVPGTAERAFAALKGAGVSVVMISQGSSEHSICCVIQDRDGPRALAAVREAFAAELARGLVHDVTLSGGAAARLFTALGQAQVNVRVIAQGSSERNISVVVDAADAPRALRAVHAGFYLSPATLSVGLIGPGNVGAALLGQLEQQRGRLRDSARLDLKLRAVASSQRMVLSDLGLDPGTARARLAEGEVVDLDAFTAHVKAAHLPRAVIIDCSASDAVADRYAAWLEAGIDVITPNKHAGAGPLERYRRLGAAPGRFHYEATVGAGLPVITTLKDLIDTGDEVLAIDGILSGTLAYLLNRFDGSEPFSALVRTARALAYTEPDPRDDLSGRDVARKLVILARENGWALSVDDVEVESLVPPELASLGVEDFMARLDVLDRGLEARRAAATGRGQVLRYTAHLDASGTARVGLVEVGADHPFAHIRLTDNVVQFTTRRYRDNPLVVQGPGAGPEVTAAGVFADLLRLAASAGARR